MKKINVLTILIFFLLTACYNDFQKQAEPITGTWQLKRIVFKYSQESPSSRYVSTIFPPDSNRMTFSAGRYYEAKTTPSYDFMYFVRFGTSYRSQPTLRQGVWEYYGTVYSPENDYQSGTIVFDRGRGFYLNQSEIFLDYDFPKDSLRLFSNTAKYAGVSIVARFLGEQESRRIPENSINYGFNLGKKLGFAEGFLAATDSLRWIQKTDYLANLQDYLRYLRQGAYLAEYEETYPDYVLFLQGLKEGRKGRFQQGYDFAIGLDPKQKPKYEIEYYFGR